MLHLSLARVASNRGALLSTRCTCMWRLMLHLSLREGGIKCGASPITRSTRRWRLVLHLSLSEGGIKMRGVAHHAQHPQVASCATPLA
jgi:transcriptional antiterminator Rof (Rho-off)